MKPLINLYWTYLCLEAWPGTQNGVNQPTFITTGLSAAPSVSGLHKDDHSLLGSAKPTASHRFKAFSQDTSDDTQDRQPSTVKAGANLSPNSSTGWSKGSQDPAGSAGSPEIVSGHIPQPSDPRPGKPLPTAQEEHSRCFSTQNRPRPSGSGTQQVLNEPQSDRTLDVGTLLLAIKLNHLKQVQGPHSGQLGTLCVSSTTTQPLRAARCWSLTNGQQLLVGVNSVIILRS